MDTHFFALASCMRAVSACTPVLIVCQNDAPQSVARLKAFAGTLMKYEEVAMGALLCGRGWYWYWCCVCWCCVCCGLDDSEAEMAVIAASMAVS